MRSLILDWAQANGLRIVWGAGLTVGSMDPTLDHEGRDYRAFGIWTRGRIEFAFGFLQRRPPFDTESKRLEFLQQLNKIPGVTLAPDAIGRFPSIKLERLRDPQALKTLLAALDWFISQVRAA
jgi:hypothetical protein